MVMDKAAAEPNTARALVVSISLAPILNPSSGSIVA